MLSKCQLELSTALAEAAKKDATIEKLTKKIEQLTASTKAARGVAREAKQYAKSIEDSENGQIETFWALNSYVPVLCGKINKN